MLKEIWYLLCRSAPCATTVVALEALIGRQIYVRKSTLFAAHCQKHALRSNLNR